MKDLYLGIDVGTGSAKIVVADALGHELFAGQTYYQYDVPGPGRAEQDPEVWWDSVCTATRELFCRHPGVGDRLGAVAVSAQGVAAVLLDEARRAIRPAILWLDTRCSPQAERLQQGGSEFFVERSGKMPASYNFEPKLMWLQENEPANWQRCSTVCTTGGYINLRLTGRTVMNHSDAGICLGYDLHQRAWSNELLNRMGLSLSRMCDLAAPSICIGFITAEAAAASGIPEGVEVLAGGEDTSAAGLAMGVSSPAVGLLSLGTANTVYVPTEKVTAHADLLSFPHVLDELILIGGSMSSGGLAAHWLGTIFGYEEARVSTDEAAYVAAGSNGVVFLPYLVGELQPINDGRARASFTGLTASTTRGHMMRAVLESNAFAIRHNLVLAAEVGVAPQRLSAVGGPSQNALLCQIIADVTGLPLQVLAETCGAALGSALIAAGSAMSAVEVAAMQQAHAQVLRQYTPSTEHENVYTRRFSEYRALYPALARFYRSEVPS